MMWRWQGEEDAVTRRHGDSFTVSPCLSISESIFPLLLELEQSGVEEALAEIQLQGLAGVGIAGGDLPVPLVITIAQILQAGAARGMLLNQVRIVPAGQDRCAKGYSWLWRCWDGNDRQL